MLRRGIPYRRRSGPYHRGSEDGESHDVTSEGPVKEVLVSPDTIVKTGNKLAVIEY